MNKPHAHGGLAQDLEVLMQRRAALRWFAAGAVLPLAACGGGGDDAGTSSSTSSASTATGSTTTSTTASTGSSATTSTTSITSTTSTATSNASCSNTPSETAGPYPGDGTNTNGSSLVNVLTQSGIVRSDIRSSFGGYSGTAAGVPLAVTLQLVNTNASCAALSGYAVYIWHCDRAGNYSLYSSAALNQNYLRGVQVSDAGGKVSFTSIFPGCYSGRWPHIHFEIYRSLALATSGTNDILTSQLALPAAACKQVYGVASGYEASVSNFNSTSLASDNVFGNDSAALQLASVTGDAGNGFTANIVVGIAA
jgi:protocatechuate 3,4-dioxygenase beta subunit